MIIYAARSTQKYYRLRLERERTEGQYISHMVLTENWSSKCASTTFNLVQCVMSLCVCLVKLLEKKQYFDRDERDGEGRREIRVRKSCGNELSFISCASELQL